MSIICQLWCKDICALCNMYSVQLQFTVQFKVYIIHCTVYVVQCIVFSAHRHLNVILTNLVIIMQYINYWAMNFRTLYSVHYTLYGVHYTLYNVHYTLYTIHYTVYTIHYTMYTIHYTLYGVHYTVYIDLLYTR